METIKINKCEGYLWWSDQQEPIVYDGDAFDMCFDETQNPFVVEGQFFDVEKKVSYSIKYVDGKYLKKEYNVINDDLTNMDYEEKTYLSNRMGGRCLKFLRYWEEKEDENCMNMLVLTLTKNVFFGFKEKENVL